MNRRGFLLTGAAALLAGQVRAQGNLGLALTQVTVVMDGVSVDTPETELLALTETLLQGGVSVSCCVALSRGVDAGLIGTVQALRRMGVEFVLDVPELGRLSGYFQAREVFEARRDLIAVVTGGGDLRPASVLCDAVDAPTDPVGIRASGLRNVLVRPVKDARARSEMWDRGIVRFYGGRTLAPGQVPDLPDPVAGQENRETLYLRADDLAGLTVDELRDWARSLADDLTTREAAGGLSLVSVSEMQMRDAFGMDRQIALILRPIKGAGAGEIGRLQDFSAELAKAGVPSTIAELQADGTDYWVTETAIDPVALTCPVGSPSTMQADAAVADGLGLRFVPLGSADEGIDGCAMLRLPLRRLPDGAARDMVRDLGGLDDLVVEITAADIRVPVARLQVMEALRDLTEDGVTRFVGLADLMRERLPSGPVAERHRLTRAAQARAQEPPHRMDAVARDALLDDARRAWAYHETYTHAQTGLCPATVDLNAGGEILKAVTMWDVGSQINALVAASEIGLIGPKDVMRAMDRILPNLAGRQSQGRLLPQGWIRTDRHKWGNKDFDGCDAGRLLSALDNLRRRFPALNDRLEKLVGSWDLPAIILDGEIMSVTDGKLTSTYKSHCAHYATLAFRRWGLESRSPYETFADARASGDGEMALLEEVASIGPIGTEPLLLEAMELGMSPESGWLAQVLGRAQEEEYEATGRLVCASETPIDRKPWFIYQGLTLSQGARAWRLDTVGHEPQYLTQDAADEYLALVPKAAFLWSAWRPGAHSDRMVAYARAKARESAGFSSSINLKSGRATRRYTDLNTNSIILQAIAHILRQDRQRAADRAAAFSVSGDQTPRQ